MTSFETFSLPEWLTFLENRHTDEIQLGLERIKLIAKRLQLDYTMATVITVAGTNGKGSTVAALEEIYHTAGYKVASYTSPHLLKFNERIKFNKENISDDELCAAFLNIEKIRNEIELTYFEVATLAALWYFKRCGAEIVLLEVGMGGRLDATNIIDADLAIITTVDLDHQDYLGTTKEAIGYEKAGILRHNKAFIYADNNPPTSIVDHARLLNATRLVYSYKATEDQLIVKPHLGDPIHVPLPKINIEAAAAAIMAVSYLAKRRPIHDEQLQKAMQRVTIKGRQEVHVGSVTTIFDVAHNAQSVLLLSKFIKNFPMTGKLHAVFSGLKDKDLCCLIDLMQPYVDFWYPALLASKRAASEEMLLSAFNAGDLVTTCYANPSIAYQRAKEKAVPADVILVYGSFLTVSGVLATTN